MVDVFKNIFKDLGGIMKKSTFLIIMICLICLITGCSKNDSVSKENIKSAMEQITEQYEKIIASNDSAEIRESIKRINSFVNDSTASKEEQKYAKLVSNFCTGAAKLSMTEKGISAFDFPEMTYLKTFIEGIAKNNDFSPLDEALSTSEKFIKRVDDFIK